MPFRRNPFGDIVEILKKRVGVRREFLISIPRLGFPQSYCATVRESSIFACANCLESRKVCQGVFP